MLYCVNARAPREALAMADQIFFGYNDTGAMFDYIEKYPNKTFIYEIASLSDVKIDVFKMYNEKLNGNFYVAIPYTWKDFDIFKDNEIKFYVNTAVTTFMDLANLKDFGVSYVLIGAPLTHKMKQVKSYGIPARVCPNITIHHPNSKLNILSGWIRPEDQKYYEDTVEVFEFYGLGDFVKASLRIYKEDQRWPDFLGLLMPGLHEHIDNRTVPADCGEVRANCGQKCLEGGYCKYCHLLESHSNTIRKIHEEQKKN